MKKQELIDYCWQLASSIAQEKGYRIWDIDYVKQGSSMYLKVFADKDGGFSINDCVDLSHALEEKLDQKEELQDAYVLEVSSPGLDRLLKKDRDFELSIGRLVDARLYAASPKVKGKSFTAKLVSYEPESQLVSFETENGEKLSFSRKELASVRLAVIL